MKRNLMFSSLALVLLMMVTLSITVMNPAPAAAEDTGVCGKSYMITINHEMYLLKFNPSPFGPDCNGSATFYWSNMKRTYTFATTDGYFVAVSGLGDFVIRGGRLFFMDPGGIILTEY